MFLVNAFYFYSQSEVPNSEEINIKTIQKLPQHLFDQNFPFWNVKLSRVVTSLPNYHQQRKNKSKKTMSCMYKKQSPKGI